MQPGLRTLFQDVQGISQEYYMRLFIGVRFQDRTIKKALLRQMHELRRSGIDGQFTAAQNLHLTLCFIGEFPDQDRIMKIMDRISLKPFQISLSGTGRFGDLLWTGVDGGEALPLLASEIRTCLSDDGILFDSKDFHPHITILRRMKGGDGTRVLPEPAEMTVTEISLMRSDRVHGRQVYTSIHTVSAKDS